MGGGEISEGEQERTDDSETRDLESSEERQEGAADNLENQESFSTDESEIEETQEAGGQSQAETDSERANSKDGKESRSGETEGDTQEDSGDWLGDLIDEVVATGEREEGTREIQGRCEPDLRDVYTEIPAGEAFEPYEWCDEEGTAEQVPEGNMESAQEEVEAGVEQAPEADTPPAERDEDSGETAPDESTEQANSEIPSDERLAEMVVDERERYGIPGPTREDRPWGGWVLPGRRIGLWGWTESRGTHIRLEGMLEDLQDPRRADSVRAQLDRIEQRFSRLGRTLDRCLVLDVAYRESGGNALMSSPERVHTLGQGGMDYFGANAPRLIARRLLPADFPYELSPGINERGREVPAAEVPGNRILEGYAARLAMANDSFRRQAEDRGFNLDTFEFESFGDVLNDIIEGPSPIPENPYNGSLYRPIDIERAWTMIFFGQETSGIAILQHLEREGGRLDDILTNDDYAEELVVRERVRVSGGREIDVSPYTVRTLVRRARVTAAGADLQDRLQGVFDRFLER